MKVLLFYSTLFLLGLLPCFLPLKFIIMQNMAKGIADHKLPLGDLLSFKLALCGLQGLMPLSLPFELLNQRLEGEIIKPDIGDFFCWSGLVATNFAGQID